MQPRTSDRELAEEVEVLQAIASGAALSEALELLVRGIETRSEGMVGSIVLIEDGRIRHALGPSLPAAYTAATDGLPIGPTAGSCGTAAFRGETVIVEDIATDALWADYRQLALAFGLRAC